MRALRERASNRVDDIKTWWCQHYNRPFKDPLLQEYTLEELWEEFLTIQISKDPMVAYVGDEEVQFRTGDKQVDEVEERIARGEEVDFLATFASPEEAQRIKNLYKSKQQVIEETKQQLEKENMLDGFEDDFTSPEFKPPLKL